MIKIQPDAPSMCPTSRSLHVGYAVIAKMKADGSLRNFHEKYGLVYGY